MSNKFIIMLIVCCLCIMTACGKIDDVSQKMINDINSLGSVTINDEAKVQKLLNTYNTLTDKQKEQVTNYTILLEAQDTIDELIATKESEEEEELKKQIAEQEAYLSIEREYYSAIRQAIAKLEAECKYPNTLEIKEIIYYNFTSGTVYISYSAENNFGNSINGYYAYGVGTGVGIDGSSYYKDIRDAAIGNKSKLPYKIGDNFYSESEEIGSDTLFVFIVNLDDFENN